MPLHTEVCTGYTPTHLTRHTSGYKHDATHLTLHTCTLHTLCYTRNAKPHSTQLMLHTELYTATHRALHTERYTERYKQNSKQLHTERYTHGAKHRTLKTESYT